MNVKALLREAWSQLLSLWRVLAVIYIPVVLLFIFVGILTRIVEDVSLAFLLRDIVATGKLPFFAGFVAQLGGMFWSASLAVCFFSLYVLNQNHGDLAGAKRLLLFGGILTLALLLDDIFLFHEEIAPEYLHINERFVVAGYGLLGIAFVLSNWREILSSEYMILLFALGLFATSIVLDALPIEQANLRYFWEQLEMFLEDGTKFAGLVTWLTYFVRYSQQRIASVEQHKPVP